MDRARTVYHARFLKVLVSEPGTFSAAFWALLSNISLGAFLALAGSAVRVFVNKMAGGDEVTCACLQSAGDWIAWKLGFVRTCWLIVCNDACVTLVSCDKFNLWQCVRRPGWSRQTKVDLHVPVCSVLFLSWSLFLLLLTWSGMWSSGHVSTPTSLCREDFWVQLGWLSYLSEQKPIWSWSVCKTDKTHRFSGPFYRQSQSVAAFVENCIEKSSVLTSIWR